MLLELAMKPARIYILIGTLVVLQTQVLRAEEVFLAQVGAGNAIAAANSISSTPMLAVPVKSAAIPPPLSTGLGATSSVAQLSQAGTNNSATLTQLGGGNLALVSQQGRGNVAVVTQSGRH
jgi:hypothetical protein